MQYRTGTVTVAHGNNQVTGVGTAWLANAQDGDIFFLIGDIVSYEISDVSGDGVLSLSTPFEGLSAAGAPYVIARDFTPLCDIPYPQEGDIGTALIFKRAMMVVDNAVNRTVKGSPPVQSVTTVNPPGNAAADEIWVVPANATGAWAGQTNHIAQLVGAAWSFTVPEPGNRVWVMDQTLEMLFTGAAWVDSAAGLPQVLQSVADAESAATSAANAAAAAETQAAAAAATVASVGANVIAAAGSAQTASDKATAAAGSATAAAASATAAAASATAAGAHADAVNESIAAAAASATAAAGSATTATNMAVSAADEAAAAASSAAAALSASGAASTQAASATASANTATAQAANSSASAVASATSATSASTSAAAATTQATLAENSANSAAASAGAASTSATAAQNSATNAASSATAAAASATAAQAADSDAVTQATNAAISASEAAASSSSATSAAATATTQANASATSASAAALSAQSAADSATTATTSSSIAQTAASSASASQGAAAASASAAAAAAAQAAAITGGYNFAEISDGTNIKIAASAPGDIFSITEGSGISLTWTAKGVTISSLGGATSWASITGKPTTIAGFGITDAMAGGQTLTVTGDATATATALSSGTIAVTLAASGVTAGTYDGSATAHSPITVDAKGRITAVGNPVTITPAWGSVTGKPTTLAGFGITDAMAGGQTLAMTGDATATATALSTGTIAVTLANTGVAAGSYNNSATAISPFTVDAKGRLTTVGTAVTITPAWGSVTGKPTTLAGYGITDALAASSAGAPSGVAQLDATSHIPVAQGPIGAPSKQIVAPATGATVNLSSYLNIINPAGALASLTLALPASPIDSQELVIAPQKEVDGIIFTGGTVVCAPTFLSPGTRVTLTYDTSSTKWYA